MSNTICTNSECKEEIPEKAKVCPYCGTAKQQKNLQRSEILAMFALLHLLTNLNASQKPKQQKWIEDIEKEWTVSDKEKFHILDKADHRNWTANMGELIKEIDTVLVKETNLELAYQMFRLNNHISYEEQMALDDLAKQFKLEKRQQDHINQNFKSQKNYRILKNSWMGRGHFGTQAIMIREKEALDHTTLIVSSSVTAGALGAIPVPFSDLFFVTPVQMGLVYKIGQNYGHELTKDRIKEFVSVFITTTIWRTLGAGVAKFIPGFGSVIGATVGFTSTYAIGIVADLWFKSNMELDADDLKEAFKETAEQAKDIFEEYKDKVMDKASDFKRKKKNAEKDGALVVLDKDMDEETSKINEYKRKLYELFGIEDETML